MSTSISNENITDRQTDKMIVEFMFIVYRNFINNMRRLSEIGAEKIKRKMVKKDGLTDIWNYRVTSFKSLTKYQNLIK